MTPFLKLEDFLAPLPLPALIAVFMTLGFKHLGGRLAGRLRAGPPHALSAAAGFILVAALLAVAVQWLALAGLAYPWLLRIIAWSLAAAGLLELSRINKEWLGRLYDQAAAGFREQSLWGKAALALLILTLTGLLLGALGPPTDADSLNYHLGVPLDILRHHRAYPRPDWLFARLAGLGEALNLLGLAGGTDILGATLQLAGLAAVLAGVNTFARDNRDRLLVSMLAVGCPVVLFLVLNQKPQLLPIAATTIAVFLIARRLQDMDRVTLVYACGCVMFAAGCKYSFMTTGAIVLAAGLLAARRAGLLGWAVGTCLVAYLIMVFPGNLQNWIFYGDPLSPFLERFRSHGNPAVIRFAEFYRDYLFDADTNPVPFPLNLFIPAGVGDLTTVLGLAPLLLIPGLRQAREAPARVLLWCALAAVPFSLLLSRMGGRYLYEPYLWIVPLATFMAWGPLKSWLARVTLVQMALTALLSIVGAAILFPGALTTPLRHRVMSSLAFGYNEACWVDEVLPADAVLLTWNRSAALAPRPFLSRDILIFSDLTQPVESGQVAALFKSYRVNTVVAHPPEEEERREVENLGLSPGRRVAGPREFVMAARNPWNRSTVELTVYRLRAPTASMKPLPWEEGKYSNCQKFFPMADFQIPLNPPF
jgi:hypothetical protein